MGFKYYSPRLRKVTKQKTLSFEKKLSKRYTSSKTVKKHFIELFVFSKEQKQTKLLIALSGGINMLSSNRMNQVASLLFTGFVTTCLLYLYFAETSLFDDALSRSTLNNNVQEFREEDTIIIPPNNVTTNSGRIDNNIHNKTEGSATVESQKHITKKNMKKKTSSTTTTIPTLKQNDIIYGPVPKRNTVPIVNEEYNVIFFQVAKAASTEWKRFFTRLQNGNDSSWCIDQENIHKPDVNLHGGTIHFRW